MAELGCDGRPVPDVLYHYTSAAGLLNILKTRTLWATDSAFLNDPTEGLFGRDEAMRRLELRRDGLMAAGLPKEATLEANLLDQLHRVIESLQRMGTEPIQARQGCYVASLSDDDDLLSQWRAYGDGGYAIGFRTADMERFILSPPEGHRGEGFVRVPFLRQVAYGIAADLSLLDTALKRVALNESDFPDIYAQYQYYGHVLPALMTIKHQAFSEEKEWRLFYTGDLAPCIVQTRLGESGLVPYVAMRFPESAVQSVVVGPGPNGDLRRLAAEQLLHSTWPTEETAPSVVPSSAPLR